jgi:hypothetical protein
LAIDVTNAPISSTTTDRKVQTTKDLEKPWAALTPRRSASPFDLPAAPETETEPERSPPLRAAWSGHSAATTILLDDSHAKAALQPHNHLCVPEYTRAQRNADLAALHHARVVAPREAQQQQYTDGAIDASEHVHAQAYKRRRIEEPQQPQPQPQPQQPSTTTRVDVEESFDETLLAVIGILHAARLQSSIAGWLRAGALLLSERGGSVWFEDTALVREWARRGREAMRELGLEVQHGIEP